VTDEYLNNNNDESELLPLALLLWSKKYFIGALVLGFVCIGVVLALSRIPIYMADALVQLETKNSGITLSEDIANLMSNESEAITEIEIIRSRMVIGRAIEATGYDIVSTPRALPVVGSFLSRLGIGRPEWSWVSAYGWNDESMLVNSLNMGCPC